MNDTIDTRDITVDSITYRVTVAYSQTGAKPYGEEWANASDIAAWEADDWHYVDVDVTPVIDGTEIEEARASMAATEFGTLGDGKVINMDTICNSHPVPDLITEARGMLADALSRKSANLIAVRDQL